MQLYHPVITIPSSFVDLARFWAAADSWRMVFFLFFGEALNHSGNVRTIACRGPSRSTQEEATEVGRWHSNHGEAQDSGVDRGPARTVGNLRRRQRKVQRPVGKMVGKIDQSRVQFTSIYLYWSTGFLKQKFCEINTGLQNDGVTCLQFILFFFVALWPILTPEKFGAKGVIFMSRSNTLPHTLPSFGVAADSQTRVFVRFLQKPGSLGNNCRKQRKEELESSWSTWYGPIRWSCRFPDPGGVSNHFFGSAAERWPEIWRLVDS